MPRKKTGVKTQCVVRHALPGLKSQSTDTYQIEDVGREVSRVAETCCKLMLFPGEIKQRDHPVIEDVEKVADRRIAVASPVRDELRVIQRQYSDRSR